MSHLIDVHICSKYNQSDGALLLRCREGPPTTCLPVRAVFVPKDVLYLIGDCCQKFASLHTSERLLSSECHGQALQILDALQHHDGSRLATAYLEYLLPSRSDDDLEVSPKEIWVDIFIPSIEPSERKREECAPVRIPSQALILYIALWILITTDPASVSDIYWWEDFLHHRFSGLGMGGNSSPHYWRSSIKRVIADLYTWSEDPQRPWLDPLADGFYGIFPFFDPDERELFIGTICDLAQKWSFEG